MFENMVSKFVQLCQVSSILHDDKSKLHFDKCIQSEDIVEGVLYILRTPYNVCPTEIKYRPQYTPYLK
jgi:hypothetical protein